MPTNDTDSDLRSRYSMDEMMAAARGGSGRRRRSKQPHVESRKRRRRGVFLVLGGFGLLLAAIIAGMMIFRGKLGTEVFRAAVCQRLTQLTGQEVMSSRFSPQGFTGLKCGSLDLTGRSGWLRRANFIGLSAAMPVSGLFSPEWSIQNLTIEDATLQFVPKLAGAPIAAAMQDPVVLAAAEDAGKGFGITPVPAFIRVSGMNIKRLTVRVPEGRGGDYSFEEMNATGNYVDGHLRLTCNGGFLTGSLLPRTPIRSITLTADANGVVVENAIFALGDEIDFRISGSVTLTPEGPWAKLQLASEPFQLNKVLSPTWSSRVAAKVHLSNGLYTWNPGEPETIHGDLALFGVVFRDFQANQSLVEYTKSDAFKLFEFRQMDAKFRRLPDRLILENLAGDRPGESKIKGTVVSFDNGQLNGAVRLGVNVPDEQIAGVAKEEGMEVFDLRIGGTHAKPTDNLKEQIPGASAAPAVAPALDPAGADGLPLTPAPALSPLLEPIK